MTEEYIYPYRNTKPYIPAELGEIMDQICSMVLTAPTFRSLTGHFPNDDITTEFDRLFGGFELVRDKLDETQYTTLRDLATRAKALFADDQDDTNGKTDQGRALLFEMEDLLAEVRRNRVKAGLLDIDGELSGD